MKFLHMISSILSLVLSPVLCLNLTGLAEPQMGRNTPEKGAAAANKSASEGPIRAHPANPHYFSYKGAPILLISSDQRFRAVVNPDFDYVAFFDKLVSKGMNFTRIYPGSYVWFDDRGNSSAPGRLLAPWKRTTVGGAHELLGGFKYDLDQWDQAYFVRLKDFCAQAQTRNIIVMVTLFNGMHKEVWENQPLHARNNLQGVGTYEFGLVQSLDADPRLLAYQEKYLVEIVRRLNEFDNVIYYLCSEPQMSNQPAKVWAPWVHRMIDLYRATEKTLPKKHLVGQSIDQEFYKGPGVTDFTEDPRIDFLTMRYLRGLEFLGSKYALNKPFVHHGSVTYADDVVADNMLYQGDKLLASRVEAWEHLVGGSASYMQYNALFTTAHPRGKGSVDAILDMLATLKKFMESFRYVTMRRDPSFVRGGVPAKAFTAALSEPGRQYAFYIHHSKRPGTRAYIAEPGRYQETLTFDFPAGEYLLEWIQPADGAVLGTEKFTHDGGARSFPTPVYSLDLALRMRHVTALLLAPPAAVATNDPAAISPHAKLKALPMTDVKWTDGFWAERFELCRKSMLPTLHRTLLDPKCAAQLNRIKFTAGLYEKNPGGVDWSDGDCYKWIETMAHVHGVKADPELDRLMDEWIAIIAKAQDEDGYISTNVGHDREQRLQMPYHHELYNMGHLLTAACIHHRATGKTNFLEVAKKLADYLYRQWKPNPPRLVHFPWNPSVYMGLVEMYRTTGKRDYLEVARIMIDNRGSKPGGSHQNGGTDQTQDRVSLRKEDEAVGHAVTGMYLYCGAADLYAETGDRKILAALERIWESVTLRKMDITGSVAMGGGKSTRGDPVHEAFGPDYAQPNLYNETCANIGNGMFNWRMLSLSGDARFADEVERVAYNCLNAAVDLKGENWFYCNPLNWEGGPGKGHLTGLRWRHNNCYCCPPSVGRTTASLHNWVYSLSDEGLWVHLYGGNELATTLADGSPVKLTQQTDYPWDGKIKLTVKEAGNQAFAIRLRIPGWTENAALSINGEAFSGAVRPGTYASISRTWKAGDVIELNLPMPVRLMEAHPMVKNLRNKVAVMRGPIVYCLELPEQEGGEKTWRDGVFLPENIELKPRHRSDFLGGVTVLDGKALTSKEREAFVKDAAGAAAPEPAAVADERLYRPFAPRALAVPNEGTVEISLIPYYAWANRGPSLMEVWIPLVK